LQAGHHIRSKTNSPIIGVLTQPLPDLWLEDESISSMNWNTYFEASHAEFLQAGGARVIPLDYRLEWSSMTKVLS